MNTKEIKEIAIKEFKKILDQSNSKDEFMFRLSGLSGTVYRLDFNRTLEREYNSN